MEDTDSFSTPAGIPHVSSLSNYELRITAHKDLVEGDEVFVKYHGNQISDVRFLVAYGFVPDINPWRVYSLVVGAQAPLLKRHLLAHGLATDTEDSNSVKFSEVLHANSLPSPSFFGHARGLIFSDIVVSEWKEKARLNRYTRQELTQVAALLT